LNQTSLPESLQRAQASYELRLRAKEVAAVFNLAVVNTDQIAEVDDAVTALRDEHKLRDERNTQRGKKLSQVYRLAEEIRI
jgi:hypothetical protein